MMDFIIYDVKAAVVLAVFYMFYRLLLSKETFHRLNRMVLLFTAVGSLLLPLFQITIHKTVEVEPSVLTVQVPEGILPVIEEAITTTPWWQIFLSILFIIGVLGVVIQTLLSIIRVMRIISKGESRVLPDGTRLVITDGEISPFSWMNTIVLSRKDYEDDHSAIVSHEQAHIRLRHSWDLLLVDLVSALQWFNPAIWMLRSDLRAVHEFEADDQVLREGYNVKQYQYLLVKKAVGMSGYSVANSFNHRELKSRITMMYRKKSSRSRVLKVLYLLPLIGVCLAANARTQVNCVEKQVSPSDKVTELVADDQTIESESVVEEVTTSPEVSVVPQRSVSSKEDTVRVIKMNEIRDSIIYVLNGERVNYAQIEALNGSEIKTIRVLKDDEAIALYGEEGKKGVMVIETKPKEDMVVLGTPATEEEMKKGPVIRIRSTNGEASLDSILVFIDGVRKTNKDINELDPLTISSFRVLRDKDAITIYGDEGKNGVIIVTTTKGESGRKSNTNLQDLSDSMRDYMAEVLKRDSTILTPEKVISAMKKTNKTYSNIEREIRIPEYYDADGNKVSSWKKVRKCVFRNLISNKKTEVAVTNIVYNEEPISEADINKFEETSTTFHVKEDGTLCVYTLQYLVDKGMFKGFS